MARAVDKLLHGEGLLGDSLAPAKGGALAERFEVPPFTILNAREGWWQERKRAWMALGIQSELGRGGDENIPAAASAPAAGSAVLENEQVIPRSERVANDTSGTADIFNDPPPAFSLRTGKYEGAPSAEALPAPAVAAPPPQAAALPGPPPAPPPAQEYVDEFKREHAELLALYDPPEFDRAAWDWAARSACGMDVECFPNFFLVCFKRFADGKRLAFEMSQRSELDADNLRRVLEGNRIVTYNGDTYDVPMAYLALGGATNAELQAYSDKIVLRGMKRWEVEREFGLQLPKLDHVDLIEATPSLRSGLKVLAGRMHCRHVVDLPFDPHKPLRPDQMNYATAYCQHGDLDATEALWRHMAEPLEMRRQISNLYKQDVRSRSDAQIGEMIVKKRVEQATGRAPRKMTDAELAQVANHSFQYPVPPFVRFETGALRVMLDDVRAAKFLVGSDGAVHTPPALADLKVRVGQGVYQMGIGGLHSTEAHRAVVADAGHALEDVDVASQYPRIIIKLGMYPKAMGPAFCKVYQDLVEERLAAKRAGDKVRAEGGKIAANGVFGKTGNVYSPLYAPEMMIGTTLTGQLSILMFIEACELAGMQVVSANTDGATVRVPRARMDEFAGLISAWEAATGFEVERQHYRALYSSSVNTYVAVREDGKVKRKGPVADPWSDGDLRGQLGKNPQMTVLSHAVVELATKGTPVGDTVRACRDPRMFLTVIKVNGGAEWRGHHLGRVVRWYWSTGGAPVQYVGTGKKVAKTDGARPMMALPAALPADVDYARYAEEAERLAEDLAISQGVLG